MDDVCNFVRPAFYKTSRPISSLIPNLILGMWHRSVDFEPACCAVSSQTDTNMAEKPSRNRLDCAFGPDVGIGARRRPRREAFCQQSRCVWR